MQFNMPTSSENACQNISLMTEWFVMLMTSFDVTRVVKGWGIHLISLAAWSADSVPFYLGFFLQFT